MPITPLPDPPSRADSPATFSADADAFLGALPDFATEANQLAADVSADEISADASAAAAAASAAAASNSAALSSFKGSWSSLTGALNKPASVLHDNAYWALLNNLADVTASEPGVTGDWAVITAQVWTASVNSSGPLILNSFTLASATGADITLTMPAFLAGGFIVVSNSPQSTHNVKLTVPSGMTIYGYADSLAASDNLVLRAGDAAHIAADSPTVGRVI